MGCCQHGCAQDDPALVACVSPSCNRVSTVARVNGDASTVSPNCHLPIHAPGGANAAAANNRTLPAMQAPSASTSCWAARAAWARPAARRRWRCSLPRRATQHWSCPQIPRTRCPTPWIRCDCCGAAARATGDDETALGTGVVTLQLQRQTTSPWRRHERNRRLDKYARAGPDCMLLMNANWQ